MSKWFCFGDLGREGIGYSIESNSSGTFYSVIYITTGTIFFYKLIDLSTKRHIKQNLNTVPYKFWKISCVSVYLSVAVSFDNLTNILSDEALEAKMFRKFNFANLFKKTENDSIPGTYILKNLAVHFEGRNFMKLVGYRTVT